jgi:hypothetical protein
MRIELSFTTAVSDPWKLKLDSYDSAFMDEVISVEEIESSECEIRGKSETYWCQTYFMSFYTVHECSEGSREVDLVFDAIYKHNVQIESVSLPLTLSGSSAFICAKDLGKFELTHPSELSIDGKNFYGNLERLYLDRHAWIKIYFSSGADLTSVTLTAFSIYTSQDKPEPVCVNCMDNPFMNLTVLNSDYAEWTAKMFLHLNVLDEDTYLLRFEFFVAYSDGRRELREVRRRLNNKETAVATTIKLEKPSHLIPHSPAQSEVEFEMRFDYDCGLVATDIQKEAFLSECTSRFYPVSCESLRCGSIIVLFSAPTESAMNEMKFSTASMTLPSFGSAKSIPLVESERQSTASSAQSSSVLIGIAVALAFTVTIFVFVRRRKRNHRQLFDDEVIEISI